MGNFSQTEKRWKPFTSLSFHGVRAACRTHELESSQSLWRENQIGDWASSTQEATRARLVLKRILTNNLLRRQRWDGFSLLCQTCIRVVSPSIHKTAARLQWAEKKHNNMLTNTLLTRLGLALVALISSRSHRCPLFSFPTYWHVPGPACEAKNVELLQK